MRLLIPQRKLDILRFAAIETYPNECIGALLGAYAVDTWWVSDVVPYQVAVRGKSAVEAPEASALAEDTWSDAMVGEFHSHPSCPPTLSKGAPKTDFEEMEPGNVEIIISIWPGRRNWNVRYRAYARLEGRVHRRVAIERT